MAAKFLFPLLVGIIINFSIIFILTQTHILQESPVHIINYLMEP